MNEHRFTPMGGVCSKCQQPQHLGECLSVTLRTEQFLELGNKIHKAMTTTPTPSSASLREEILAEINAGLYLNSTAEETADAIIAAINQGGEPVAEALVAEITETLDGKFALKLPTRGGSCTTFCNTNLEAEELAMFWRRGYVYATPQPTPEDAARIAETHAEFMSMRSRALRADADGMIWQQEIVELNRELAEARNQIATLQAQHDALVMEHAARGERLVAAEKALQNMLDMHHSGRAAVASGESAGYVEAVVDASEQTLAALATKGGEQ